MLKKLIAVMAMMLLSAGPGAAKEAVEVSTGEVVASIDRESTLLCTATAVKQAHLYFEGYRKANANESKTVAKIKALDENDAAEMEKLTATLAANRQLQAGCLSGYITSLTSVIDYNIPNLVVLDETRKKLEGITKDLAARKDSKKKAKLLAKLEESQAKVAEANKTLIEMLAYLEQVKSGSKSRIVALNQETVVTAESKTEAPAASE